MTGQGRGLPGNWLTQAHMVNGDGGGGWVVVMTAKPRRLMSN